MEFLLYIGVKNGCQDDAKMNHIKYDVSLKKWFLKYDYDEFMKNENNYSKVKQILLFINNNTPKGRVNTLKTNLKDKEKNILTQLTYHIVFKIYGLFIQKISLKTA